ncbi:MAG: hypothetical protein LBS68_00615 [Puniceicoccales bacterium]|nr:hypothetical protein [Puniceicoccales bacterium]
MGDEFAVSIPTITLKSSFNIPAKDGSVSVEKLKSMITISDWYNAEEMYIYDPTINNGNHTANYECIDDKLKLYSLESGEEGYFYKEITSNTLAFSSSAKLFLKRKNSSSYVDIYSLHRLDRERIFSATGGASGQPVFSYKDTATRVTAVLYASGCYQRKIMEQFLVDIDAVKEEQELMKEIGDLIAKTINQLGEDDAGTTKLDDLKMRPLDAKVWAFFLMRGLLTSIAEEHTCAIDKELIEKLKVIASQANPQTNDGIADAISSSVSKIELTSDQAGAWADTLRIYAEQVSNDSNARTTKLQMVQQMSQQDITTASTLMKAAQKTQADTAGNIR